MARETTDQSNDNHASSSSCSSGQNEGPYPELQEFDPNSPIIESLVPIEPTVEQRREKTRGWIAHWLLAILTGIVIASFCTLWLAPERADALESLLTLIFAPVIGLLGAVTGFFYGEKSASGGFGR